MRFKRRNPRKVFSRGHPPQKFRFLLHPPVYKSLTLCCVFPSRMMANLGSHPAGTGGYSHPGAGGCLTVVIGDDDDDDKDDDGDVAPGASTTSWTVSCVSSCSCSSCAVRSSSLLSSCCSSCIDEDGALVENGQDRCTCRLSRTCGRRTWRNT